MSNASNMKRNNMIAIMQLLQRNGGMTKNQMATELKLSSATVHNIVTELKEKGFCKESTVAISTGGRNAVIHEINKDGGLIVGQTLFRNRVLTNVFDYGMNNLFHDEVPVKDFHDVDSTIRLMIERIRYCVQQGFETKVIGVGISMMGRINDKGKVINISGYPEWKNVYLRNILMSEINLPIFIENDNNAYALAQKWNVGAEKSENTVFYHLGECIGVGILIDGKVFKGSNNNGCEFGHISIMVDGGPKCVCGNYGCLEAFIKDGAILEKVNQLPEYQDKPFGHILDAVRAGRESEAIHQVFMERLRYVVIGIEHIMRLFDPEVIVVRSKWIKEEPSYFDELQRLLSEKYSITDSGKVKIIMDNSKVGAGASACVFLERFYSEEEVNIYL